MYLIRRFEEGAEESICAASSTAPCTSRSARRRAPSASACRSRDDDQITSTHRGHGHCIAKGADLERMMAEFFGRRPAIAGPRRLDAHRRRRRGAISAPTASSAAAFPSRSARRSPPDAAAAATVAVCFFGDGATNEGAFHEALNMAAIWKLPVVFVCENNKYGMSMSTERSTAVKSIAEQGGRVRDAGRDRGRQRLRGGRRRAATKPSTARAPAKARRCIECQDLSHRGHSKSDRNRYRTKEEIDELDVQRDPIGRCSRRSCWNSASHRSIAAIAGDPRGGASRRSREAIEFAKNEPDAGHPTKQRITCILSRADGHDACAN